MTAADTTVGTAAAVVGTAAVAAEAAAAVAAAAVAGISFRRQPIRTTARE
ncbi:hypothetical protein [Mycobacterium sp.]|nr:hypothetical protein [Mycobacterium sp.]HTQ21333.1 hypothetical protein [Mycobacterium sp.]